MSKDWEIGSGFVKEPKITKIVGKNKDGYGDAEIIETSSTIRQQLGQNPSNIDPKWNQ